MRMYIPALGNKIRLTEDWFFDKKHNLIEWEFKHFHSDLVVSTTATTTTVRIPKDTILSIQRIYIRKGAKEYDSVTFHLAKTKEKPAIRFYAHLTDVNAIEFEPV